MNGYFFTFNKEKNSTAVPSGGTLVSFNMKAESSVLSPRLELATNVEAYNYVYLPGFNRYYFIEDITLSLDNYYIVSCSIDVLASYRSQIMSTTAFVERAAAGGNRFLQDTAIPMRCDIRHKYNEVDWPMDSEAIHYIVTCAGPPPEGEQTNTNGCTTMYILSDEQMSAFLEEIYTATIYGGMDDVTKMFYNPFQYVISCVAVRAFPIGSGTPSPIRYGWYTLTAEGLVPSNYLNRTQVYIDVPRQYGDYRDGEPYSDYTIDIPYCGQYHIPAHLLHGVERLMIDSILDYNTGQVVVALRYASDPPVEDLTGAVLMVVSGQAGFPVPLAQLSNNLGNIVGSVSQIATNVAGIFSMGGGAGSVGAGGAVAAGAGVVNSAASLFQSMVPSVSYNGGIGNRSGHALFNSKVRLSLNYPVFSAEPEDIEPIIGLPVYDTKVLNTCGGYVKTYRASVTPDGAFGSEIDMINSFLDGGVYLQ